MKDVEATEAMQEVCKEIGDRFRRMAEELQKAAKAMVAFSEKVQQHLEEHPEIRERLDALHKGMGEDC